MAQGALGFALVSVAGFSVWAFGARLLDRRIGEIGMYAVSTLVFVLFAGLLLHPLVIGSNRIWRFYKAFFPAFFAYAVVWSGCWFALHFGSGEWLGSLAGCVVFGLILRRMLGSNVNPLLAIFVLFVGHSAGYFVGWKVYLAIAHGKAPPFGMARAQANLLGQLLYGVCYGLGFGAGIGYAFARFQRGQVKTRKNDE